MSREDFLQGLETSLSGNIPPTAVRENLRYYSDYIQAEVGKGRAEADVMDELGDPRLIARTIMDTTPGAGDGVYEEYHSYGPFGRPFGDGGGSDGSGSQGAGGTGARGNNSVHYYDLSKWYWKLFAVILVVAVITLVITIVTGLLSLVIPLLPVIGLVILIMWFIRGFGR